MSSNRQQGLPNQPSIVEVVLGTYRIWNFPLDLRPLRDNRKTMFVKQHKGFTCRTFDTVDVVSAIYADNVTSYSDVLYTCVTHV